MLSAYERITPTPRVSTDDGARAALRRHDRPASVDHLIGRALREAAVHVLNPARRRTSRRLLAPGFVTPLRMPVRVRSLVRAARRSPFAFLVDTFVATAHRSASLRPLRLCRQAMFDLADGPVLALLPGISLAVLGALLCCSRSPASADWVDSPRDIRAHRADGYTRPWDVRSVSDNHSEIAVSV